MSPNPGFGNNPADFIKEIMEERDELEATLALMQLQQPAEEPFITLADDQLPHQLDSIAWNHRHALFAFASYEINQAESGRRIGNIYLACLLDTSAAGYILLQTLSGLPGVLDIKWEPSEEKHLVAATSESVIIYSLDTTNGQNPFLTLVGFLKTGSDMALYVSWINPTKIIYSDSAGNLVTWNTEKGLYNAQNEVILEDETVDGEVGGVISSSLHKYFVWFVHFDTEQQLVYSGDDCGFFRGFHLKDLSNPSVHAKHQFQTGVTSILTKREFVLIGCYDDHLRVFIRTVDNGIVKLSQSPLLDMDLGGTVWRTMWLPPMTEEGGHEDELKVAVAAGRNGIHVISMNPSDWSWETIFCCLEHKGSLAYGLDIHFNVDDGSYTMATVYFDTRFLHIFSLLPP